MRTLLLLGVVCGLLISAFGCGSSDSGGSTTVASSGGSAPPPPPGAGSPSSAPGAAGSDGMGNQSVGANIATGSPDSSSAGGYPGGSGPPGSSGYPGAPPGASGYPGGTAPPGGYPGGSVPPGASGYPGAEGGYGDGSQPAAPPRPKSLRQKAVDAFREGRSDDGVQLLSAHYLTSPSAGPELGRVMQWSPGLRKPTLVTRIGIAIVYSSQPPTFEGHPQPIGSRELDASLGSLEQRTPEGRGEGGARRPGGRRPGGRPNEDNAGAAAPPIGIPGEGGGYGGGENQLPTTPQEELAYYTGEVGTTLLEKIRTKLESGALGAVYREALKELPVAKDAQEEGGAGGSGGPPGSRMSGPPGAPGGRGMSGPRMAPPGVAGPGGGPPGGEGSGAGGQAGGVLTGQLVPGVEFLGAAENIKELGEIVKASSVDAVIYFDVSVRPATANTFVNNDTRFRLVSATELSKQLFSSATLNNKKVHEARKKRGAEDPVAKEIDGLVAALDANFKHVPLPALTSEQAMKRLKYLLELKPEDATSLLLEARLFVAKKLLKTDEVTTLALTEVTEDQLDALSQVLEDGSIKEQIASALTGKSPDAPTTMLGKFGAALSGAGGLGKIVPTPSLPPGGLPGAFPPGGASPPGASGYGPAGPADPGALAPPGLAPSSDKPGSP